MTKSNNLIPVACAVVLVAAATAWPSAEELDLTRSRITVHVYKSGLFSPFADNHVIEGKLHEGSITLTNPAGVTVVVRADGLGVLDPGLAPDKRNEVQARMIGPEVLDAAAYPEIRFASTAVHQSGPDRWHVAGDLTIHGQTRPIEFDTSRTGGVFRGSVRVRQHDFGITPISIIGGTVKVKDEILIEFEIATVS
jgi:YceI-like domain